MIKLVALYKKPDDVASFEAHYNDVHAPLVGKVPGIVRVEVTRNLGAFRGDAEYYMIAEMYFQDKQSFDTAMASEENRALGKDLMSFARNYVTLIYGEVEG